jgi:protein-tyrosine phosphatase
MQSFVDIHCHLLPEIDDGPGDWETALEMARLASRDGIGTVIATPHQAGQYSGNTAVMIRDQVDRFRRFLLLHKVPLRVLPGADVRVEDSTIKRIRSGELMTLGDHGRHLLIELPHDIVLPLERLFEQLGVLGIIAILSHPERNRGLMAEPDVVPALVRQGCLMQVTAGSLLGDFGSRVAWFCENLVRRGLVHFVSTDAHDVRRRRPVLSSVWQKLVGIGGERFAWELVSHNPRRVALGESVVKPARPQRRRSLASWIGWRT